METGTASSEKAATNARHPEARRAHGPPRAVHLLQRSPRSPGAQLAHLRPLPSTANTAQLQRPAKQSRAPGRRSHWPGLPRRAVIGARGARGGARPRCESRRPSREFGAGRAAWPGGAVSPALAVGASGSSVPVRLSDGGGGARAAARVRRRGGEEVPVLRAAGRGGAGFGVILAPGPRSLWRLSGSGRPL